MSLSLDKPQKRHLSAYLRKSKPYGWRERLETLNNGPGWQQFGMYYEYVLTGEIGDSLFRERWLVDGEMLALPSVATQSEKGLTNFLLSIQHRRGQKEVTPTASQPPTDNRPQHQKKRPQEPQGSKTSSPTKERKRTISLMIEPSLYDEVKRLADLEERSVGAQIRHALKQNLKENSELLKLEG